jgi:hypothetical protein
MNFESELYKKSSVPEAVPVDMDKAAESGIEKIDCAVVELNGELFTASNHILALVKLKEKYPDWQQKGVPTKDGFLTTSGRFVDREEAFKIAEQADQLDSDAGDDTRSLESERLH